MKCGKHTEKEQIEHFLRKNVKGADISDYLTGDNITTELEIGLAKKEV